MQGGDKGFARNGQGGSWAQAGDVVTSTDRGRIRYRGKGVILIELMTERPSHFQFPDYQETSSISAC